MQNYIYTVITNGKDTLNEEINAEGAKLVCFTNDDITSDKWEIRKLPDLFIDPRRNSRMPKIMPHIYMPDADYTLYMDGNLINTIPLQQVIDDWGAGTFCMFRHAARNCYFDEAKECIRLGLDDPELIISQCQRYKHVPKHAGLYNCGVMLRKNIASVNSFNEKWWAQYCTGSRRDQISFAIAAWEYKLKITAIHGGCWCTPGFEMVPHKILSEWAGKV